MTLTALLQDAAKKALEEMFGGQQDVLAAYDAGGGNIGKVPPLLPRKCTCTAFTVPVTSTHMHSC